nr:hypothetical protein [Phaeobacter inhibens]
MMDASVGRCKTPDQLLPPCVWAAVLGKADRTVLVCLPHNEGFRHFRTTKFDVFFLPCQSSRFQDFGVTASGAGKRFDGFVAAHQEILDWDAEIIQQPSHALSCVNRRKASRIRQQGFPQIERDVGP